MTTIRIVAALLDTEKLTLYKEDGEEVVIPQGDARIRAILDVATDPLSRNEVVEVNIDQPNHYQEFEEQSSGFVKFFRVLKKAVKHIFNPETDAPHEEPVALGNLGLNNAGVLTLSDPIPEVTPVPTGSTAAAVRDATENVKPTPRQAVDQIMAAATPVSSDKFREEPTSSDHTIIAVVETGKSVPTIIPGMENIEKQFAHANKLGSPTGVKRFLERLAAVIDKRGHSVEELLQFMEKGDLPIADDGCIVAYKRLFSQGSKADVFVDPHTRKVTQKVGTYVFMNEKLVDPNRRNECSNGLHIGRRQYMGSFSGDVIVMCKIKPEDVIAVPYHDRNKMRVAGYHILFKCSPSAFSAICSNRAMTEDSEAGKMLGQALRGEHVGILQTVEITQGHGGGLKITNLVSESVASKEVKKSIETAKAGEAAASFDDTKEGIGQVDPNAVSKDATEKKVAANKPAELPKTAAPKEETRAEKITRLSEELRTGSDAAKKTAAEELATIQRKAKKSFDALGVSKSAQVMINNLVVPATPLAKTPEKKAAAPKAAKPAAQKTPVNKVVNESKPPVKKAEPKKAAPAKAEAKPTPKQEAKPVEVKAVKASPLKNSAPKVATPKKAEKAPERAPEVNLNSMSRNQKAAHFVSIINDDKWSKDKQRQAYKDLLDLKKKAKVSWSQLNVTNFDAIQAKFEK